MDTILEEIKAERAYQQNKWGDDFDSKNTANDWLAYILGYAGGALTMPYDKAKFRKALIKTATLCIAAVEWCDKGMAKRHYD